MNNIALISGLLGALLSATLGFAVRWYLDQRAQRENERRLAYVHLVSVSELVAAEKVARAYLAAYVPEEIRRKLNDEAGRFDPSHALSALAYDGLSKMGAEDIKSIAGRRQIILLLQSLVDSAKASSMSPVDLARMPKDAVLAHTHFQTYVGQVKQALLLWADILDDGNVAWMKAETIHDTWLTVDRLWKQSVVLRKVLVDQGACTEPEAERLLKLQMSRLAENYLASMTHKARVQAALEDIRKEQRGSEAA